MSTRAVATEMPEEIRHDLAVAIEADEIHALQKASPFGVAGCIYCMIAAAARRSLLGIPLRDLKPSPYEVFEGDGGEWNVGEESWGWTHYMRMSIAGKDRIVLVKVSHEAAIATGEMSDLFRRRLSRVVKLLGAFNERVMLSPHDCGTPSPQVWVEDADGNEVWNAGRVASFAGLIKSCASSVDDAVGNELARITMDVDDV